MLEIQIITSKECNFCASFLKRLSKLNFTDFVEYDADDPSKKTELDAWRITNLPVVQIVDEEGMVKYRFPYSEQGYSPRSMRYKRDELSKKE